MDVVVLALVLVVLALAAHLLGQQSKFSRAVNRIPGPPIRPFIGNAWDLVWTFKGNQTAAFTHWYQTYKGIYRFWVGTCQAVVSLGKPEDLEILLSSSKHIDKSMAYKQLHPWIGLGLLTSTGNKWHSRRKLITPTFHFKILDQFVDVFNRNSDILVQKLLATKGTVNVNELITLCTLDIICETAMGTKVEAQKDATSPYVAAVHDAILAFHMRAMRPWLSSDAIFSISPEGRTFNKAVKVLHRYTSEVIESRRREREARRRASLSPSEKDMGLKKKVAFLDQLMEASDALGNPLTDRDIQEEVDTFMFEGHDTTAAGLAFVLYNIAANPHVQDQLVEEMETIFGDSDRATSSLDIQNMKYTERVVKESLRLYPSVPVFARAVTEDVPVSDGYVIPAGCDVIICCYQMGRDPSIWPEPEKFDPDRFLPENTATRHPYAYVPFSAGPRNCIGQKFAMTEMKSAVSKIVRHCRVELPSPDYTPEVEGQVILRARGGVLLNVSPRRTA